MALPERWTIRRVLDWTKGYLADKGIENARLETEWLLAESLGLDRVGLYVNYEKPLTDAELGTVRGLVTRRAKREPLQYLLGSQEFAGLEFIVSPAVLIPRHDTEVLLTEALRVAPAAATVLDLGTGSGCLAVALAKALPAAQVTASDISPAALAVAAGNAVRHGAQVEFLPGPFFTPVGARQFELIVSNPPYISSGDLAALQVEVREFEPLQALDGGPDGLDCYRRLVPEAVHHLVQQGWLVVEIGIGQAAAVQELFAQAGFSAIFTAKDPAHIDRVVGGTLL
jgi:release factor glutamine methyltransferase